MSDLMKGSEYLVKAADAADVFTPEDFDEEQRQMRDTTKELVDNEILPKVDEIDSPNFALSQEILTQCGELGLLMTDAPEEYGGLALDKVTSMLIAEEIAHTGSFSVTFTAHTGIGTLPLIYYGTHDQKEKYLEKLITGEWPAAYCLTEPGSGSDAIGVDSTAVLSDDKTHYVLNGTKQFITNGSFAKLFTVFVKIDKEHFTAFLVEKDFEGVTVGAEEKKLGIKGSSTTQIIMDNVKVPVENLLGEIGKGHHIAFNVLNVGRLKLGVCVNGAAKEVLKQTIPYSKERKQFGLPISKFGAIQEKYADRVVDLYAAESLTYRISGDMDRAIGALDNSSDDYYEVMLKHVADYAAECAIAKVYCSDSLREMTDESVQIYGGYGFTQDYPAERFYRDERINRIFEGTNEINRLLIPDGILKKAMKGQLPLQAEAMKAIEALMSPSFDMPGDELYATEKRVIANAKQIFLVVSGAAVQKFMMDLAKQQELLLAIADVAIQIYALESAVLRAEKNHPKVSEPKQKLFDALVTVVTFNSLERISTAAKRGAFFCEEGDTLTMLLSGIRRYSKYDATGLLASKKLIAAATLEAEKYPL